VRSTPSLLFLWDGESMMQPNRYERRPAQIWKPPLFVRTSWWS
jgi:hypothetical protein